MTTILNSRVERHMFSTNCLEFHYDDDVLWAVFLVLGVRRVTLDKSDIPEIIKTLQAKRLA